jgi:hypothetical protein
MHRTTQSTLQSHSSWLISAAVGGLIWWGVFLGFLPSPWETQWARLLLLLAPLVLVPLGFRLWLKVTAIDAESRLIWFIKRLQLPTAVLLVASQFMEQSVMAAALASSWLVTTGLIAIAGARDAWKHRPAQIGRLCIDAGLVYLVVGGAWSVIDRTPWRPLDFEPVIVMLTSIHFHFAGFVLPVVSGLTAQRIGGRTAAAACIGVVAGMPLVAIGITGTKIGFPPMLESFAAWWMSIAGWLTSLALLRAARGENIILVRVMWMVAVICLAASMALAALYGMREVLPVAWLNIPLMRATHGTANALGFGLLAILGWTLKYR